MRRSTVLACVLALLAGCKASIVEPTLPPQWTEADAGAPLSHDDCIGLAMRSAPTAAAWEARLLAARAALDRAGLLANPTLSLGIEDFPLNSAAMQSQVQTTLSLAVALQDLFERKRRESAAQEDMIATEAELHAEVMKLAADVSHAYDQLVAARSRVQLDEQLAAIAQQQHVEVRRLVSAGMLAPLQRELAEAELEQSQADLAVSRAQARALEIELAFALGFERPVPLPLAEPMTDKLVVDGTDIEAALADAAKWRPEIAAAEARYRAERERLQLAADRAQFLPVVGAGPRVQGDELRGVATIDVALPLFDSGAASERAHQAALLAAAAQLRSAARQVAREVFAAAVRLTAAESYLSVHARSLADRRRVLRERTEQLFHAGQIEYAELALARRDEVRARIALLEAEVALSAARVDFDAALGSKHIGAGE
jgi:outer membrane protein TolC